MTTIAILSDIHGNKYALDRVIDDMSAKQIDGLVLLGDLIDYGMQSNEIIEYFSLHNPYPVFVNIWGNHEREIITEEYSGFSSERGEVCARYTRSILTRSSIDYLKTKVNPEGKEELIIGEKSILAVHGSLMDPYWKSIFPDDLRGDYKQYDYVLSGHSHIPHWFAEFYPVEDPLYRNKKRVVFINPGSVGQPRNHSPRAQYTLLDVDTGAVEMRTVEYDVPAAMNLFKDKPVDSFYGERLERGV